MNAKLKIGIAVLAGAALGVSGTVLVHAQQAAAPGKGYVVSETDVTDAPTFAKYVDTAVPANLGAIWWPVSHARQRKNCRPGKRSAQALHHHPI